MFLSDRKTQKAVTCEILVVGEAEKRLPKEFREKHAEIPWSEIAGMRDKLVHDYDKISLELLWETVTLRMPELVAMKGARSNIS